MYLRDLQDEDFEIAIKVEDSSLNPNRPPNLFAPFLLDKRCGGVQKSNLCTLIKVLIQSLGQIDRMPRFRTAKKKYRTAVSWANFANE